MVRKCLRTFDKTTSIVNNEDLERNFLKVTPLLTILHYLFGAKRKKKNEKKLLRSALGRFPSPPPLSAVSSPRLKFFGLKEETGN